MRTNNKSTRKISTSVYVKVRVLRRDWLIYAITRTAHEYKNNIKGGEEEKNCYLKFENKRDFFHFISSSRAVKILFLSFTCEDIGVAMVTNMISQLQESFPLRRFRFAHLWEILSATENEICIPARPFNIYYLSVEPVLTLKPLKSD